MASFRLKPPHLSRYTCERCLQRRRFAASAAVYSGHSKWSTIKHDKAKNDAAMSRQRTAITTEIVQAVKLFGPNPADNSRLGLAIANAKKASTPKTVIENAIARGQGISASGAKLENVTLEVMMPPSIAAVVECETDSKLRTVHTLRAIIKDWGGNSTPTAFLFTKRGRVILRQGESHATADDVLEAALEAGAEDVEDGPDGTHIIYTGLNNTATVAQAMAKSLAMEIASSDIVWNPNEETKVPLETQENANDLVGFIDEIQEAENIQAIYTNIIRGKDLDAAVWAEVQSRVNS